MTVAYDALIASVTPEPVTLAEVRPMEILQGWTFAPQGVTNTTYYCAWSTQIAASIVPGGLYRLMDGVMQNDIVLASRGSALSVDSNPGSFYFDLINSRIYVSTTTGSSPDAFALMGAFFKLFFSTRDPKFTGYPLYLPIVTGALPSTVEDLPDLLFGSIVSDTGSVSFLNGDGLFDKLSQQYVWRNKTVTFKSGGIGLDYPDYATMTTMRINRIDVDDEVCTLQLETMSGILNRQLPLRTWGDGVLTGAPNPSLGQDGIKGLSQPIVLYYAFNCPLVLGGRTPGVSDSWYAVDANAGPYGSYLFVKVWAMNRTTKALTLLTSGADYTTSGAVVTIVNASYFYETYDILAEIENLAFLTNRAFGTMARALLELCGESTANIDTAAFAAADIAAPQEVARFLGERRTGFDWLLELCASVNGQVYYDTKWTCRILTPDIPASVISLSDANGDFATWKPADQLSASLNEVRVRWGNRAFGDDWYEASASDDTTKYANETSDSHRIDSWFLTESYAQAQAHHLLFFHNKPGFLIEAEMTGLSLLTSHAGDLVLVTRARAPLARTGRYDGHALRIVHIEKRLDGPSVTVTLNDLNGKVDNIFRLAASGSTVTWSTATAAEQARLGFLGDTNRYVGGYKDLKVLW